MTVFYFSKTINTSLVSPVLNISRLSIGDNIWFPKDQVLGTSVVTEKDLATMTAKAAFFVDTQTGEVLYEKNSHARLRIASLAKIMTAIITLEYKKPTDMMAVSQRASDMEPDKMFLQPNEKLSATELLSGIFLDSGNDAAEVLAERVTGRREEFITLMNSKAAQLGMKDTLFINPSGLEEDDLKNQGQLIDQYSSAYDVILMSRYAIRRWPLIIDISSQPHIFIPQTTDHQDYDLYSGINLLTTYPGVVGLKTGFTPEAGLTLVTLARKDGKEVLGVILGATDRRDDAKKLLDYSFQKLSVKI